ncbi:MAG: hypothetical protein JWP03_4745 [Phycisphaerales bacterium]|nr:hypothetical protein [Phycisphaerales bacterium]
MRYTWLGALVLGLLPAVASADHGHGGYRGGYSHGGYYRGGHSNFGFSFGLGIGPVYGYSGYSPYCYSYSPAYYAPAYYPPPAVVYSPPPVTVYNDPPVYSAQPVYYRSYTVSPAPTYAPGPYYYGR